MLLRPAELQPGSSLPEPSWQTACDSTAQAEAGLLGSGQSRTSAAGGHQSSTGCFSAAFQCQPLVRKQSTQCRQAGSFRRRLLGVQTAPFCRLFSWSSLCAASLASVHVQSRWTKPCSDGPFTFVTSLKAPASNAVTLWSWGLGPQHGAWRGHREAHQVWLAGLCYDKILGFEAKSERPGRCCQATLTAPNTTSSSIHVR